MFDEYPVDAIIIGQPFYNSFLTQFNIVDNETLSNNAIILHVNQEAQYDAYIGNSTYNTSAINPFIYVAPYVEPPVPAKSHKKLIGILIGFLIFLVVVLTILIWKCRKQHSVHHIDESLVQKTFVDQASSPHLAQKTFVDRSCSP